MEEQQLLEQANAKMQAGEYREAVTLLKKVKRSCHNRKRLAYVEKRLGEVYLQLKVLDKAREHFHESVCLNKQDSEGYYFLSLVLFISSKPRAAIKTIRKALSLRPDDADGYYLYGLVLEDLHKLTLADVNFRRALEFNQGHIPALLEIAKLSLQRGDKLDARRMLKRVLAISPDYLPAKKLMRKLQKRVLVGKEEKREQVLDFLNRRMSEMGYSELQREKACMMWHDFFKKRKLQIRKPEIWAAGIHYAMARLELRREENQRLLAHIYGVSMRSVSSAFQDICAVLRLHLYDKRYSTQSPPADLERGERGSDVE